MSVKKKFFLVLLFFNIKIVTLFLIREFKNGYTSCRTNESLPIVFADIDLSQYRESQRKYDTIENHYFCDLGDDQFFCDKWWTTDSWEITNSIKSGMTFALIDERWQALNVYQLEDKYSNGMNKYTKLSSVDDENTVVPISWSFSGNAELYFCTNENIHESFCLKLTFDEGITLQCIGFDNGVNKTLVSKTNWTDKKWRTFLWFSEKGGVKLKKFGETNQISYTADEMFSSMSFKYLFGHSIEPSNFLKIHNYNFLLTKKAGFYQIGKPFWTGNGKVCISFYVSMCKTCKMIFIMAGVEIATVEFAEEGIWKNIRINVTNSANLYEQLYIRTVGNEFANINKNYWAIDFVSLCSVRFISIHGEHTCEHPYPEISSPPMEFFTSLKDDHVVYQNNLEFFKILSFINGTILFMYKSSGKTTDNNNTVSMKCLEYHMTYLNFTGREISNYRCTLWPDYFCGAIKLNGNDVRMGPLSLPTLINCSLDFYKGSFMGRVRFSFDDKFEKYRVLAPPGHLLVNYTRDTNSLIFSWTHPFINNNDFQGFRIDLIMTKHIHEKSAHFTPDNIVSVPKKAYNITITNYKYESCTEHFAQVRALNGKAQPGFAATTLFAVPPYLPSLEIRKKVTSSNITISFKLKHSVKLCQEGYTKHAHFVLILASEPEKKTSDANVMEVLLNKKFPEDYHIIRKFKIGKYQFKSDVEILCGEMESFELNKIGEEFLTLNFTVDTEKYKPLIIMEFVRYWRGIKYFDHTLYVDTDAGGSNVGGIVLFLFLLVLIIVIIFVCCVLIKRCKRNRKSVVKNVVSERRPTTVENIYFLGDRVQLLDKNLLESISKVEQELVLCSEIAPEEKVVEKEYSVQSKRIRVADFDKYLKMSISNKDLNNQFDSLPNDVLHSCITGQLECNKPKNRFKDIIPYDNTRVKLEPIQNREGSDYINASYIKCYKNNKAYIATQGPKSLTINDFWRMIWGKNIRNIIMLINLEEAGVKKVEKYWPNPNEDFQFGKIHVYQTEFETWPDFEIRCFKLVCGGKERKVYQYHFQNWPDNGVPMPFQSLVGFIRKTLEIGTKSPLLVHCCSGTSSTAVFILCHICLQEARKHGIIDVLKIAHDLRDQRVNMIHNLTQYKLAHLLILECLGGPQVVISCNDDIDALVAKLTDPEKLELQLAYLDDNNWQYRALFDDSYYDHLFTVYPEKNKVPDIYPDVLGAIELDKYPEKDESSCYINAVKVDGYRCCQRYIVTQQPMPNTLNDFWRMVIQQEVKVIVSLNVINLKDKKSCSIWPTEDNSVISPVDFIIVKHHSTEKNEIYDVIEVFVMVQGKQKKSRKVTIVSMRGWKSKSLLPDNLQQFLKFCGFVDTITRQLRNTVVTCYDGCTASGLYVASSYLIEMIKVQKNFDVCNTVRVIRRDRKQFIGDQKQLAFLYEIAATYIKGYQDYANFGASSQPCYNIYDYIV